MNEDQLTELAEKLVCAIGDLAHVNRLAGLWDHVRHEACHKPYNEIDTELVVLSEWNSRKNIELRARFRTEIDDILKNIVNLD